MTEASDFIVIGAGVYGAATAWHLACAGASVSVFEADNIGIRASGGPGRRGVRANGRDVRELTLMRRAYEIWPTLHQTLEVSQFYERCGHLLLAESNVQKQALEAQAWIQREQGIKTEFLDSDQLRKREPALSNKITAALYCPNDGVADHSATTQAYAAAAMRLGVNFYTSKPVKKLELNQTRAHAIFTNDGERHAANRGIFILANAGTRQLVETQLTLPLWEECLQVLISAPLELVPFKHIIGHIGRTVSLKTHVTDRIMISGGWHGCWDPLTHTGNTTKAAVDGNLNEVTAIYPALKEIKVDVSDANHLETFTPDKIPIIDKLPSVTNLWYATGWCGHGWAIAPVVAEGLAKWAIDGERPTHLAPFRLSRFTD